MNLFAPSRLFKIAVLLFVLLQVDAKAQMVWKFKGEKDGIKTYNSDVPNSKIKALKLETTFQAPLNQLVAVLLDIKSSPEWAYKTKSATVLKQVSPTEVYYYTELNMPWPVTNRDFVGHLTATQNPNTKVVIIDGPVVPDYVPKKKDLVRIEKSVGKWVLTPINDHETKVEYSLQVDPGGGAPAWLVNTFASEGPTQSLKNLRSQLKKSDHKNTPLPFNRN
ncbi:MAG: lipid-binding protein [Sphingobacteriaceae bacterium]|nr:MAG: lipid-binding protein [Sphingobacteriaceae bacterium]